MAEATAEATLARAATRARPASGAAGCGRAGRRGLRLRRTCHRPPSPRSHGTPRSSTTRSHGSPRPPARPIPTSCAAVAEMPWRRPISCCDRTRPRASPRSSPPAPSTTWRWCRVAAARASRAASTATTAAAAPRSACSTCASLARVLDVDPVSRRVIVEPGVSGPALEEALRGTGPRGSPSPRELPPLDGRRLGGDRRARAARPRRAPGDPGRASSRPVEAPRPRAARTCSRPPRAARGRSGS